MQLSFTEHLNYHFVTMTGYELVFFYANNKLIATNYIILFNAKYHESYKFLAAISPNWYKSIFSG